MNELYCIYALYLLLLLEIGLLIEHSNILQVHSLRATTNWPLLVAALQTA